MAPVSAEAACLAVVVGLGDARPADGREAKRDVDLVEDEAVGTLVVVGVAVVADVVVEDRPAAEPSPPCVHAAKPRAGTTMPIGAARYSRSVTRAVSLGYAPRSAGSSAELRRWQPALRRIR